MSSLAAAGMSMRRSKSKSDPNVVELQRDELLELDMRAQEDQFESGDGPKVHLLVEAYLELTDLVRHNDISMARLQRILFGASTEKTSSILPEDLEDPGTDAGVNEDVDPSPNETDEATGSTGSTDEEPAEPAEPAEPDRRGHGRNGAEDYPGAQIISISHASLQPGDACPECGDGTVYERKQPGTIIRVVGQAPLQATVYELQKLRCNLCGKVFTAEAPDGVAPKKYDATTGSMVALLKYGSGLPFNRLRRLQGSLGIPLPAATQWDIVHAKAKLILPAFVELIRQAAQGDVLYNDDTNNKILEFMGERARKAALAKEKLDRCTAADPDPDPDKDKDKDKDKKEQKTKQRTGLFTTGIVSQCADWRVAVFFTGRRHSGENLGDVLRQRAQELEPPIQMCDALSRNIPSELRTILANCLAHYPELQITVMVGDTSWMWSRTFERNAAMCCTRWRRSTRTMRKLASNSSHPSRDCSSIRPTAARSWTNFTSGSSGNSMSD
jgi:transposase